MSLLWKSEGYSNVSPYLIVTGAQSVVDFLKQTFDAAELRRYDRPDGSIMHTELRIGESVQEPQVQEGDPDRRGGVKDPSGNYWWISTQIG